MHNFHSNSTIFRIRAASILLVLGLLTALAVIVLLVYSLLSNDRELALLAILLAAVTMGILLLQIALSRRSNCPLCMTPVLATKHCSKHRKARRLLGSYRLRVAVAVLLRGTFTCPYCHERSEMRVRDKRSHAR